MSTTDVAERTLGEEHVVHGAEGTLVVVDHQAKVQRAGSQNVLTLHASEIRRVQIDIELRRPTTVAIVPNARGREALVLTVEAQQLEALSRAMLHLGLDLDEVSRRVPE